MKKIFSVLCVLIVLSCVLSLLFSGVGAADVSHNKKIVSVVYDDSGSMRTSNRYVYANYAMETFCSLLGAEDDLHITYMNDYSNPRKMDLSDNRIQSSVDQIRNRLDPNGTTPYESVIKAMEILRNKNDTNEKTEYILVVITDGAFSGYPGEGKANSFSAFSDERMANGTKPNIIYLGIGSGINELNLNKSNIKEFYACDDANDKVNGIVGKMSEIANVVSGRSQVNSADIKAVNSTTVEIKSDVPLSNIAALVQSGGKITSVKHKETGKTLTVGRNVSSSCKVGNISLSSQSFLIEAKNENIPAGTYVLTFDQAVAIENLVVMYEPALELRLTIRCNGRELDKLTELDLLHQKDLITVSYDIYEYGTDKIVSLSSLPAGTTASLTVYENGTQKKTVNGSENTIRDYSLNLAKTEFKAVLQLPNFNPIEAFIDFTPLKYVNYTVGAEYGGGTDSVMLKDISGQHNLSIVFTLYADGVPVTDPAAVN
ncbi:MAG: VWA domain-containing protein, partial [Clostridia bacterium]|nr:VWA domain-containing protein [Clostridia bacterium]